MIRPSYPSWAIRPIFSSRNHAIKFLLSVPCFYLLDFGIDSIGKPVAIKPLKRGNVNKNPVGAGFQLFLDAKKDPLA